MLLAHGGGGEGAQLEFFVLAAAMLVLGITLFFQKDAKPLVPVILVVGAFALIGVSFFFDKHSKPTVAPQGLSISIISPEDGSSVPAGSKFPIEVDIVGGSVTSEITSDDPTEGHLHVFVDGALDSMPTSDTPTVELEEGSHSITVEFTKADHSSFEPRILDEVEVTAD